MGTVGVNVAVIRNGSVLLTERDDYHVWCLPGGHLDPGETFPDAAIREVREETGLAVALTGLVGLYTRPRWDQYNILLFAAELVGGEERPQAGEVLRMGWFGPDELPDALLLGTRHRSRDALAGRRGVCRIEDYALPFGRDVPRQEAYRLRDQSGPSPQEFYRRHFASLEDGAIISEIG